MGFDESPYPAILSTQIERKKNRGADRKRERERDYFTKTISSLYYREKEKAEEQREGGC